MKSLRALLFACLLSATVSSAWAQYVIAPSTLPQGLQGSVYATAQLTTTPVIVNATPTWSISSGSLPAGLTLDPVAGTITGTPTVVGLFTFTVKIITTPATQQGTRIYTLPVSGGTLTIVPTSIPGGSIGVPYNFTPPVSGGVTPYAWRLEGANTNGLSINVFTGKLSGTPVAAGTFPLLVTLTDSVLASTSRAFTLTVIGIPAQSLPAGTPGVAYPQTLLQLTGASGTPAWTVTTGTLPPGLTLSDVGVISGTPTTGGVYPFTVGVTDGIGNTASQNLSITIGAALSITTTTLPDGITARAYSATVAASGGQTPYTWSIGSAPEWLTIDPASGTLRGTPPAAGTVSFTVSVATPAGAATAVSRSLSFVVTDALQITSPPLSITLGQTLSATFTASGGTAPYTWSATSLPAGLTLDAASGLLSGTPTAAGTFAVNVTAQDSRPQQASVHPNLVVTAPAVTVTIGGLPAAVGPAAQPLATVAIASAFPTALSGTLTLTFVSAVGGDDQLVRFANGTRTASFTIAAGSTQGVFAGAANVLTGTVAGTITIKATLLAGTTDVTPTPQPTQNITVNSTPPVITGVKVTTVTGGFAVVVTGFSTPRNMTSALFHFAPTTGTNLAATDITVQVGTAFTAWYNSAASNATGSQFTMTVPFNVSGATFPITAVTVQLTNSAGNSAVSPPANP